MKKRIFRKIPVEVEAVQFNGNSNKAEIEEFTGRQLKSVLESETAYEAGQGPPLFSLIIETKEGDMKVSPGDYVIKEPFPNGNRDFYPCKPDIFKKTYNEVVEKEENRFEIYAAALKKWGGFAQMGMLNEEATELALATRKFMRNEKNETYENMLDEIADVEIMIEQIKKMYYFGCEGRINERKEFKIKRLKERIENDSFE